MYKVLKQAVHGPSQWQQNAHNNLVGVFQLKILWQKTPWERKFLFCLRECIQAQGRRLLIADNIIMVLAREQLVPCSNRIKAFSSGRADRAQAPSSPPCESHLSAGLGKMLALQLQVNVGCYSAITFSWSHQMSEQARQVDCSSCCRPSDICNGKRRQPCGWAGFPLIEGRSGHQLMWQACRDLVMRCQNSL